jgi:hypothetical protein
MVNSFRYLLVLSVISSLSLVGCKSDKKTNPVKTNRAKATNPQVGTTAQNPGEQKPGGVGQSTTPTKPGTSTDLSRPGTVTDSANSTNLPGSTTPTVASEKECKDYVTKMTEAGWEKKQILNKTYSDSKSQLIFLAFAPKNSLLKNPVLMLPNLRNELDKAKAESFLELAKKNEFDPIFVDIRGENCSEAFGKSTSHIQLHKDANSKLLAAELEKLRKEILKDQAWKVWSYSSAGLTALRLAEQYPGKVKGLYLANFVITEQFKDLVQARIEKQIEIWNEFKTYAKTKELEINDDLIKKIRETIKKESCANQTLCGEVGLNAYLLNRLSDKDAEWTLAVDTLKKLSLGEVPNEIKAVSLKNIENRLRYEAALQITDRNADLNNSACTNVTAKVEIKEKLEKSLINSCQLEAVLNADIKKSVSNLQSGGINLSVVRTNLNQSKAQYFVSMSQRSLLNPIELLEKHKEIMKDVYVDDFDTSLDFETFTNEGLLEKLK